MAVTVVPIQIRRGNEVDFNASKMLPGEFAVSLDEGITRIAFSPGNVAILAKQSDVDAVDARVDDLELEISGISSDISSINTALDDLSPRVAQAESRITSLGTSLNNRIDTVSETLNSQISGLSANVNEQISDINDEIETLKTNDRIFSFEVNSDGHLMQTVERRDSSNTQFELVNGRLVVTYG